MQSVMLIFFLVALALALAAIGFTGLGLYVVLAVILAVAGMAWLMARIVALPKGWPKI
ncbi:MAG: hypothetical protein UY63_C0020G0003 [Parcubacteria group bacterium GW2011_GWA2_51_10]|nr:MAG: hypothetical protein UY63_C0020G0003 [Parcubacteria group bacterium GW2011_GWA2_51_10]